ncbi:MAG: histidine phosphatase family protein [Candidatus Micrarchaeota archaeon]|nr:histidine phosphatase family protein [Candidatus Micrarchaeota archaeon]MDE1834836.1 histidine phosphatase family protein [Candidatus Micrarchaeota archaeon]
MKLIIVRHGQTVENVTGVVQGHRHGRLTKKGVRQAKRAAYILKGKTIDVAFSSDLRRTIHTAREIVKFHEVPVYQLKELRERHAGVFEGRHRDELMADEKASGISKLRYKPKGGESLTELRRRTEKFAKRINKKYKGRTVLIVTHGLVVKCLVSLYLKMPLKKAAELRTTNGGILIIDVKGGKGKKLFDSMFK